MKSPHCSFVTAVQYNTNMFSCLEYLHQQTFVSTHRSMKGFSQRVYHSMPPVNNERKHHYTSTAHKFLLLNEFETLNTTCRPYLATIQQFSKSCFKVLELLTINKFQGSYYTKYRVLVIKYHPAIEIHYGFVQFTVLPFVLSTIKISILCCIYIG